jgi:outer membrane protein
MKQGLKYFSLTLCAFILGMTVNNYAISNVPSKVAVIDVVKVANTSSKLQQLKKDRENKLAELATFVKNANATIAKETDKKKKAELEAKYKKELNNKKEAINKDFSTKANALDKTISNIISQKAKANNFELVLTKGVVLYGGTDITDEIIKSLK